MKDLIADGSEYYDREVDIVCKDKATYHGRLLKADVSAVHLIDMGGKDHIFLPEQIDEIIIDKTSPF